MIYMVDNMKKIKKFRKNVRDMDKVLFGLMLGLIIFGTLNIVTASSREVNNIFLFFAKQVIILILSFALFFKLINVNTKEYSKIGPFLYILVLVLNLYLIVKGGVTRGASNWIDLKFFKLQPSELAKPVIIMMLSVLFDRGYKILQDPNAEHKNIIGAILFVGIVIPIIVFFQKDLGTCIILVGIFGFMYLSSPILPKEKIKYMLLGIFVVVFAFLAMSSYKGHVLSKAQESRLDFFNPCSKYEKDGYQICNAFIAINNGGLTGLGIGKSTQKYSYIPEPHTDMVFAIIAEENGVLKCSIIFISYIIILFRILLLASKTSNIKSRYICIGVATYMFMHILINLGGLFGLMPLTGVPLPFLSYGGSFTLSFIGALGMVQRVYIENKNKVVKV